MALESKKAEIERKIRLREFVFGVQDGLISTVGLLTGVAAATGNRTAVVVTGITAALTGGLSMATGSYLSARTEQEIFEKEFLDQKAIAAREPYVAAEALLEAFSAEGLDRASAYRVVQLLARRPELLIQTVQEKVLGIGSADLSQPFKAASVMFASFLMGAAIPIFPYLLPLDRIAMPVSWTASVGALLAVGVGKGVITGRPRMRSGLEFAGVALFSAAAGWIIGRGIQIGSALFGLSIAI